MRHAGSAADDWPQQHLTPGGSRLLPSQASAPSQASGPLPAAAPVAAPDRPAPLPAPAAAPAPVPAPAPERRRPRLYVIDALRIFAAVFVGLHHYIGTARVDAPHNEVWGRPASHVAPTLFRISAYGWIGVEIFFVISGFVICMSCWDRRPRDFFVSRVIRLYPAYWFAVVFTSAVLVLWPAVWPAPRLRWVLFNLSMLQQGSRVPHVDGVYWTLWSELRFYLLFLLVVATGLTYRKVVVFCCGWAAVAALAPASGLPALVLIADPDGAWYFIAGLALFLMYRFGQDMLLWGILGLSWVMAQNELANRVDHVEHVSGYFGATLIYTAFLLFMVGVAVGLTDRIQWKWLATAGSLTYPFYLTHYAAGTTAIHYLRDSTDPRLLVGVMIALFLGLSYLVHRLVERPLSRLLKRGLTSAFVRLGTP